MTDTNLSSLAQTVLGPVPIGDLGPTLTHEHLLIDLAKVTKQTVEASEKFKMLQPVSVKNLGWVRYDMFRNIDNQELFDEMTAISEVSLFKRWGGKTIVDATTSGIGRDPNALARISRATDINIVMGTGYYVDATHPTNMSVLSQEDLTHNMVKEITAGVGGTEVRAGIIGEIGCSWPLTVNENKILKASAVTQRETGASILVHPGRNETAPFDILDILYKAGADMSRVIISHVDRTITNMGLLLELAQRECYIEFDVFGRETSYYPLSEADMPNDTMRIGFIRELIDQNHISQIVVAQDICTKNRLAKFGGHGYHHLFENIIPRMHASGISQDEINTIMVANPGRILGLN